MITIREICFDTETTGLDPLLGDRLVEIGCIELIDGKRTSNYFHELVNPERDVPEEAVAIHGITTEQLIDKPKFPDIADKLLEFLGDSILVAHNAAFDIKFLNFELELAGRGKLENTIVDSLTLAKSKFPGQKNNLDALCKRYNIDNSARTFHGALLDAELLADVYIELNGGAQKSFIEENNDIIKSNVIDMEKFLKKIKQNQILQSRNFKILESDRKNHDVFLEKYIPNNLWKMEIVS